MTVAAQFHALTTRASGRASMVTTAVAVSEAFDPAAPPTPLPRKHHVEALWDTGASHSVITKATAAALNLPVVGQQTVNHAGGSGPSNTYVVNIELPNRVGVAGAHVTECPTGAGQFGAILGMDIITQGDFAITNVDGKTCLSFRIPSIATIDYVEEAKNLTRAHVGRNDPCPCGSGKKFKKCHGA